MKKHTVFWIVFTIFGALMTITLNNCAKRDNYRDFAGDIEIAEFDGQPVYRLKTGERTIAIMNFAGADYATCLYVLREAARAMDFIEEESGVKLDDLLLIELLGPEDMRGAGGFAGEGRIRLLFDNGYVFPSTIAHEIAHLIRSYNIWGKGLLGEGIARYYENKYYDKYFAGHPEEMGYHITKALYNNYWKKEIWNKINLTQYGKIDNYFLFLKQAIQTDNYTPVLEVSINFYLLYAYSVKNPTEDTEGWRNRMRAVSISTLFTTYLIEQYGWDMMLDMASKEVGGLFNYFNEEDFVEYYNKTLDELESEFTNYVMSYEYRNEYLSDQKYRQEMIDWLIELGVFFE